MMNENDLETFESDFKTQTSTVLLIDISHSMILYGEDRITPAKKVAMALSELIMKKYKKADTLVGCLSLEFSKQIGHPLFRHKKVALE